jgi:hypothetical protein
LRAWARTGKPPAEALDAFACWTADQAWIARLSPGGMPRGRPEIRVDAGLALETWRATAHPEDFVAASGVVCAAVYGLWGVRPDAPSESVAIAPALPASWPAFVLRQLRVGGSMLELELRRNRSELRLAVRRVRGPALRLVLTMPEPAEFEVDGERLGGGRAVFRVEGEHEVAVRT